MPRYLVGIDLGTTNTALAYVDTASRAAGGPKLHTFHVPQVVAAGQVGEQPLLPSFLYLPGPHDLAPGSIDLPWRKDPTDAVGVFARNHGAKVPGRQVASAKSWLSHPGVDRTAPLLPWAGPPDVSRLSPLDVSARYLKHLVEAWLPGGKLDAAQFGALVQACRAAKEALLAENPPPTYPVTVMGRGRSVVGGSVSVNITPDDVTAAIFDGFFPHAPFDAEPTR